MALFIDLQAVQRPASGERGIGRYSVELTRALLAGGPVAGVGLNPMLPRPEPLAGDLHLDDRLVWTTAREVRRVTEGEPFVHLTLSPMEGGVPAESVLPPWIDDDAVATLAVLYDVIPYLFPEYYMPDRATRAFFQGRELSLRQVDRLLAISEYTRRDVIRSWGIDPGRVVTIGSGASSYFHRPDDPSTPGRLIGDVLPAIRGRFVLSVAGYDWRKNAETLIDAWGAVPAATRDGRQLVLTCRLPDEVAAAWMDRAAASGLHPDEVVVTGFVPDEVLRALYQAADLLVFPSRYEGFGLPVLEAARCGTPSITSDRTSLPEILELPTSTFDPDDEADIAAVLGRALSDEAFAAELEEAAATAAATHTWERVAERVREAEEAVMPRRASPRPLRVAVVGAPTRRARLVDALRARGDTSVEGFGPGATSLALVGGVHTFDAFDRVVVIVDDDVTFRILEACGRADVVVIATLSLVPTRLRWITEDHAEPEARALAAQLVEDGYGGTRPHGTGGLDLLDPSVWERAGLGLLGPLTRHAGAVVAVEPVSTDRVRLEAGPAARVPMRGATDATLPEVVAVELGLVPT